MMVEEVSFVKIWPSTEGDVSVSTKDYYHVKKRHFTKCDTKSYFYWSDEDILWVFAQTLAYPDVYLIEEMHDTHDRGIFLKTFPDDIGFSHLVQKPCRTARAVVSISLSGLNLITFYPQEFTVKLKV